MREKQKEVKSHFTTAGIHLLRIHLFTPFSTAAKFLSALKIQIQE
jgi:hypothetical protein